MMEGAFVERAIYSIETYLSPELVKDQRALREVGQCLVHGELVIIRNAFKEAFAERVFACLDEFSDWKTYERYEKHFHYHHHNIYDPQLFPQELTLCSKIFDSQCTSVPRNVVDVAPVFVAREVGHFL